MHGALWDMDGTLVDTADLHFAAWLATCLANGRGLTRAEFFATFGRRNEETIPDLFGDRFSGAAAEAIAAKKEELYRAAVVETGVELLPGGRALLERFAAAGWRQAIGSSAPRLNVEQILRQTGTAHLFDAVVTGDDVERGKPHPDVFLRGAERLGLSPETCIVLEDAPAGVAAAKAAGMRCIAVMLRSHHTESDLRQAGADWVVRDLTEVTTELVSSF